MKDSLKTLKGPARHTPTFFEKLRNAVSSVRGSIAGMGLVALGAITAMSGCTPAQKNTHGLRDAGTPASSVRSNSIRRSPAPAVSEAPVAPEAPTAAEAQINDISHIAINASNKIGTHSVIIGRSTAALRANARDASIESGITGAFINAYTNGDHTLSTHNLRQAQTLASLLNSHAIAARRSATNAPQHTQVRYEGHTNVPHPAHSNQISVHKQIVGTTTYYAVVAFHNEGGRELWRTGWINLTQNSHIATNTASPTPRPATSRRRNMFNPVSTTPLGRDRATNVPHPAPIEAPAVAPTPQYHRVEVAEMVPMIRALNADPVLAQYLHFGVAQDASGRSIPSTLLVEIHHGVTPGQANSRWNLEGQVNVQYPVSMKILPNTTSENATMVITPYQNTCHLLPPISAARLLGSDVDRSQPSLIQRYRIQRSDMILTDILSDTPRIPVTQEDRDAVRQVTGNDIYTRPTQVELDQMANSACHRWANRHIRNYAVGFGIEGLSQFRDQLARSSNPLDQNIVQTPRTALLVQQATNRESDLALSNFGGRLRYNPYLTLDNVSVGRNLAAALPHLVGVTHYPRFTVTDTNGRIVYTRDTPHSDVRFAFCDPHGNPLPLVNVLATRIDAIIAANTARAATAPNAAQRRTQNAPTPTVVRTNNAPAPQQYLIEKTGENPSARLDPHAESSNYLDPSDYARTIAALDARYAPSNVYMDPDAAQAAIAAHMISSPTGNPPIDHPSIIDSAQVPAENSGRYVAEGSTAYAEIMRTDYSNSTNQTTSVESIAVQPAQIALAELAAHDARKAMIAARQKAARSRLDAYYAAERLAEIALRERMRARFATPAQSLA